MGFLRLKVRPCCHGETTRSCRSLGGLRLADSFTPSAQLSMGASSVCVVSSIIEGNHARGGIDAAAAGWYARERAGVTQSGRVPAFQAGCRGFESRLPPHRALSGSGCCPPKWIYRQTRLGRPYFCVAPFVRRALAARSRLPAAACDGVVPWPSRATALAPSFGEFSADEPERVVSMPRSERLR